MLHPALIGGNTALLDMQHRTGTGLRAAARASGPPRPVASIAHLVGARTRDLRQQRGMTRRALSLQTGVSERYLALLERGSVNVSLLLLERIAHALEIRLSDLLAETAPRQT